MNTEKMTATFTPSSMTMAEGSLEHSAGSNTDPEPTSYSRGVPADAQQRYDDVIGDFPDHARLALATRLLPAPLMSG